MCILCVCKANRGSDKRNTHVKRYPVWGLTARVCVLVRLCVLLVSEQMPLMESRWLWWLAKPFHHNNKPLHLVQHPLSYTHIHTKKHTEAQGLTVQFVIRTSMQPQPPLVTPVCVWKSQPRISRKTRRKRRSDVSPLFFSLLCFYLNSSFSSHWNFYITVMLLMLVRATFANLVIGTGSPVHQITLLHLTV